MNRRLIRAPSLASSIRRCAAYIGERNPKAALRFVEAVEAAVRRIADMPELGSLYEPIDPELQPLRFAVVRRFKKYVIFDRFDDEKVEIYRVVHGSMDLDGVLWGEA